jgi:hypothetical protein
MTKTVLTLGFLSLLLAGCPTQGAGERCNPLRATSDCDDGLTCVYPTAPECGVSYCCAIDTAGNIADVHPNCRPDPLSAMECGLDLSTPVSPMDLSSKD